MSSIVSVDNNEASICLEEIIEVLRKHKLKTQDLVLLYGNLGYSIGASIEGIKGEGPSVEELQKKYYESPTLGTSMMLQGILVTSWNDDLLKTKGKENE